MSRYCRFVVAAFIASALCRAAIADQKYTVTGTVSLPANQTSQSNNSNQNNSNNPNNSSINQNDKSLPDCSRPTADPRCKPTQTPYYYPHRPRPVIINQLPPQPAIDINSLTDDWEGCRKAKLGAMRARDSGDSDQANRLDEWLWKNCRSYSNELRQLEQNGM